MDQIPQREQDFDLEAGETVGEELGQIDTVSGAKLARIFLTKLCQGFESADGTINVEADLCLPNSAVSSEEKLRLLIDKQIKGEEAAGLVENQTGKEKRKKSSAKKPPKPPRPPGGLSLDAADQKLIKEIAELAMLKRARIERLKALKKMRAVKASSSSSNGNLFSMLFTIIFCLVILFQGVSSRISAVSFQCPPESARSTQDGFTLNCNHHNPHASDTDILGFVAPKLVEQVYGIDTSSRAVM